MFVKRQSRKNRDNKREEARKSERVTRRDGTNIDKREERRENREETREKKEERTEVREERGEGRRQKGEGRLEV